MHSVGDGTERGRFVNNGLGVRGTAATGRTMALSCVIAIALGAPYREVQAAGLPVTGSEATTILKTCTQQSTTLCGDPVTSTVVTATGDAAALPGMSSPHRFFLEVPAGLDSLTVELFDADIGGGVTDPEPNGYDLRNGAAYVDQWEYRLFDPSGAPATTTSADAVVSVSGAVAASPTECDYLDGAADNDGQVNANGAWCAPWGTVAPGTIATPAAGHWRVEIAATNSGTNRNGFGVRASGSAGGSPVEVNVYSQAYVPIGKNPNAAVDLTMYPYVTGYCGLTVRNAEFNDEGSISVTAPTFDPADPLFGSGASAPATFGPAVISTPAGGISSPSDWDSFTHTNFNPVDGAGLATQVVRRGIWSANAAITPAGGANYGIFYFKPNIGVGATAASNTCLRLAPYTSGDACAATNPVAPGPWAETPSRSNPPSLSGYGDGVSPAAPVADDSSWRVYFPTSAGGVPQKPSLVQAVYIAQGPNPPVIGQTTTYAVYVKFVNPTAHPIVFGGGARVVTAEVPVIANGAVYGGGAVVTQGTFTEPGVGTQGDLVWDPGTVAAGGSATLTYTIDVARVAGTPNPLRVTGAIGPSQQIDLSSGTRAQYFDETGVAEYAYGPLCPLSLNLTTSNTTTPVTLGKLSRQGNRLDWSTASEAGTLGFNVYSVDGGDRRRLNDELVAAQGNNSTLAHDYSFELPAGVNRVQIEEIEFNGKANRYGPFEGQFARGADIARQPVDWQSIRTEQAALNGSRVIVPRRSGGFSVARLKVSTNGIYRVSHEQLTAAGVDLAGSAASALALLRNGQAVDRRVVAPGGVFGPGAYVEFVGEALDTLYTRTAVYELKVDQASARNALTSGVVPGLSEELYAEAVESFAPDALYEQGSPTDDPWYARRLTRNNNANPVSTTFSLSTPQRRDNTEALLRVSMFGGLDHQGAGQDHSVSLLVNGQVLATNRFDGATAADLVAQVPASLLLSGANTIAVRLNNDTGFSTDRVNIDSVSLTYQRRLQPAADGRLAFSAGGYDNGPLADSLFRDGVEVDGSPACVPGQDGIGCRAFGMTGFASADIIAYRLGSDGRMARLAGQAVANGGTFDYRVASLELPLDRYYAATTSALMTPQIEVAPEVPNLLQGAGRYLIVAHPSFISSLNALVSARQAEGYTVKVVSVDDVYSAYSAGVKDPDAVDRFLVDAKNVLGTEYVLLVGGDTYDYFNNLGINAVSFIPTWYRRTDPYIAYGATDLPYADTDGDGDADLALGRFPVRTVAELNNVITKTLAYGTAAHANEALFVADRADAQFNFANLSNQMESDLGGSWSNARVHLDNYPAGSAGAAQARTALAAAVNDGRALVNFIGHSAPAEWTFDALLTTSQINGGLFTNTTTPAIFSSWGCWTSYFVVPQYNSMVHALLLQPAGGAAMIGTTGLADTGENQLLGSQLYSRLRTGMPLGEALRASVAALIANEPSRANSLRGTSLMGDPALKLRIQ